MQEALYAAIQAYTTDQGAQVNYDSAAYPYWFDDAGERYGNWTPRLLRAAYNYQVSQKDPGTFAHGGKYIFQLMYDSIEDLGGDVSNLHRIDHGHFAGSEEAFRHWDEDRAVPASCARCHSADGLPDVPGRRCEHLDRAGQRVPVLDLPHRLDVRHPRGGRGRVPERGNREPRGRPDVAGDAAVHQLSPGTRLDQHGQRADRREGSRHGRRVACRSSTSTTSPPGPRCLAPT